jgi:hypothetical protein
MPSNTKRKIKSSAIIAKPAPVEISGQRLQGIDNPTDYFTDPYYCSNLGIRHTMSFQPVGLRVTLLPCSLTAINILYKIGRSGSLSMTVRDPKLFPFNHLGLELGDVATFDTQYAFYCDNYEAPLTILGLICTGNPGMTRRSVAHGVRVMVKKTSVLTNLIVVSPERMDVWVSALQKSFMNWAQIRTKTDLAIFSDYESCYQNNVILVSSAIYPELYRTQSSDRVRWARIIIEEHENNPMDNCEMLPTDMYLFLMGEVGIYPSEWIEASPRSKRFKSMGVVRSLDHFPELFYVRSDPVFVEMCKKSTINRELFATTEENLSTRLGKIAFNSSIAQNSLADRTWAYDRKITEELSDSITEQNLEVCHKKGKIVLESACLLGGTIVQYHGSIDILDKSISQIVGEKDKLLASVSDSSALKFRNRMDVHASSITDLHQYYLETNAGLEQTSVTEINQIIRKYILEDSTPSSKIVPHLIFHNDEEKPVTGEDLVKARSEIPDQYSLITGKVSGYKVFCPNRENKNVHIAIAILAGQRIHLVDKNQTVVIYPGIQLEETIIGQYYALGESANHMKDKIRVEYMLLDKESIFTNVQEIPCLIESNGMICRDVIPIGSILKL